MLALTFRKEDRIFLDTADGRIAVVFLSQEANGKIRIGFDAPKEVRIVRDKAKDKEPKQ